jgi:ATP-binding cassette subfamily B protein
MGATSIPLAELPGPRPAHQLLRRAGAFVAPHRAGLLAISGMALGIAALGAFEPLALKWIFDALGSSRGLSPLGRLAGVLFGVFIAKEVLAIRLDRTIWRVRIAVHESITRAIVERIHSLPLAYHAREGVGSIMLKMDRGINGAVAAFSDVAFQMAPTLAYLALSLLVMFRLEWRVTLLVCALVPLPALIAKRAAGEQAVRERTLIEQWAALFGRFNEVLSGIAVVKSFAMEDIERRRFLAGVSAANELVLQGVAKDTRTTAAKNLAVVLARMSAIAFGGYLVARGQLSVGGLVAFLGYLAGFFGPVQGLTGMYQTVHRGAVGLQTIFSILDAEGGLADSPDALDYGAVDVLAAGAGRPRGHVEFRNVTFGYGPAQPVLSDVNLTALAGETVAIVGPSGAGKTTLMSLLLRHYEATAGEITIDGVDIRKLTQRSLRAHLGVVLQEGALFSDTVRDNIAFGRPGASLDEIVRAARDANAHEFIELLPRGYETPLGERGGRLSAGQRQRIAIARALLKDPTILVLDEATSALDAENEALVQDAMRRLRKGRTTLVVAHRLVTVTSADRIVVVRDGRVTDIGSHEELLSRGGYYAQLVDRQVRGLLVDAA